MNESVTIDICVCLMIRHLDNGDSVDVLYLDFKKTFDSVPHARLLNSCIYGFRGDLFNWIQDFLIGCQQRVYVNGSLLVGVYEVISEVPRGSVLGPPFLCYLR